MKILVLSDSHSALSFMRMCIDRVRPDYIIHLGDYYDDARAMAEEYPGIPLYQVPGNCDSFRCSPFEKEVLTPRLGGVDLFMTHGHRHHVKQRLDLFLQDARIHNASAALYGHTHVENCYLTPEGMWVLNPGSCGYFGGSCGVITVEDKKITSCRIYKQKDLEEL